MLDYNVFDSKLADIDPSEVQDSNFSLVEFVNFIEESVEFIKKNLFYPIIEEILEEKLDNKLANLKKEILIEQNKFNKEGYILFSGYSLSIVGIIGSLILRSNDILVVSFLFLLACFIHTLDYKNENARS